MSNSPNAEASSSSTPWTPPERAPTPPCLAESSCTNALCRRQRQRQVQASQHRRATESSLASFDSKPRWDPLPLDEPDEQPSPPPPQHTQQRKRWSLPLPLPRAHSHSQPSALPAVNDDEEDSLVALNNRKLFAEWVEPEPEPVAYTEPEEIAPISAPTTPASPPLLTPPLDNEIVTGPSFPVRRDLSKPRDKAVAAPPIAPQATSAKGEWEPLPAFVPAPATPAASSSSSSSRPEKWAPRLAAADNTLPPSLPEKGSWAPAQQPQAAPPPYPGPSKPRRHSFAPFIFRPAQVPRVAAPPRPAPSQAPAPAPAPRTPPPPPTAPAPYVDPTHPAVSLPPPPPPSTRRQSSQPPASPKTVALHNELALLDPELVPGEFGANRRYSDIERRLGSSPKASSMAWSGPGGVRERTNSASGEHHTQWSIGWRSGRH